ncbi:SDR family NAD(P)-dependent oxidoreductase [Echinicola jeungdonensis]|uniref:SDR family NAD(P)-dependent oxidoreductase n=1 Tax=Echinicola jeungdonensis TaxID=709343 RepID=A0ABV5J2W1_9BACT|nr:SDR family NAD(P)-dependent oxidoreductase [Echinicola jeungdonensis]MDN3667980.1 SDR family NAD(P)-dependent oxidoreductase [Echinicola jeungdonensis]
MAKTIFITGASKGFGRIWAEAALKRGDKVAGTARNLDDIKDLTEQYKDTFLGLKLDVNNRQQCFDTVNQANEHFGGIDVLISNAGYGHFGFTEEISEEEARNQIETNVFGSLWVIQAVLPIMRKQQSGHILQVSSVGGVAAFPLISIYHASKWAVEGLCESLSQEVKGFGINVTLIEPSGFSTEWGTASSVHSSPMEEYEELRKAVYESFADTEAGDPKATGDAILKVIDAENPPLRVLFGKGLVEFMESTYQGRINTWKEWRAVTEEAQG